MSFRKKHWPIRNLFNDEIFPIYGSTDTLITLTAAGECVWAL